MSALQILNDLLDQLCPYKRYSAAIAYTDCTSLLSICTEIHHYICEFLSADDLIALYRCCSTLQHAMCSLHGQTALQIYGQLFQVNVNDIMGIQNAAKHCRIRSYLSAISSYQHVNRQRLGWFHLIQARSSFMRQMSAISYFLHRRYRPFRSRDDLSIPREPSHDSLLVCQLCQLSQNVDMCRTRDNRIQRVKNQSNMTLNAFALQITQIMRHRLYIDEMHQKWMCAHTAHMTLAQKTQCDKWFNSIVLLQANENNDAIIDDSGATASYLKFLFGFDASTKQLIHQSYWYNNDTMQASTAYRVYNGDRYANEHGFRRLYDVIAVIFESEHILSMELKQELMKQIFIPFTELGAGYTSVICTDEYPLWVQQ